MASLRSLIVTLSAFLKPQELQMGMWIEMGVFALVFVFAIHQFHDLKQEKLKRERKQAEEAAKNNNGSPDG
jgi:16S rRNA U1498 N3-methylase RsmE